MTSLQESEGQFLGSPGGQLAAHSPCPGGMDAHPLRPRVRSSGDRTNPALPGPGLGSGADPGMPARFVSVEPAVLLDESEAHTNPGKHFPRPWTHGPQASEGLATVSHPGLLTRQVVHARFRQSGFVRSRHSVLSGDGDPLRILRASLGLASAMRRHHGTSRSPGRQSSRDAAGSAWRTGLQGMRARKAAVRDCLHCIQELRRKPWVHRHT